MHRISLIVPRTIIARSAVLAAVWCAPGFASTLSWYTGDPAANLVATVGLTTGVYSDGQANIYDAFIVPTGGWTVSSVFSYNAFLPSTVVTQANWQIRSGLTGGSGGTLVASGITAATQSLDFSISGYNVDKLEVDNLNVTLAPGEYWLSVAPVMSGSFTLSANIASTVATTDANAVGLPTETGNGALTFDNFPAYMDGYNNNYFANPSSGGSARDWSMGLYTSSAAAATPEPSTLSFMAVALLLPYIRAGLRLADKAFAGVENT